MNLFVPSVETVRRRVSVPAVAHRFGLDGNGERFLCPFHDDRSNPNLVALPPREGDPVFRYFCNSCGAKGDSLDLVRGLRPDLSYNDALRVAGELIGEEPEIRSRPEAQVPDASWEERIEECRARALEPRNLGAGLLAYAAGWEPDRDLAAFLAAPPLGWGIDEGARVVMPHRDPEGNLTAVKLRCHPPEDRFRAHGPLRHLYGSHWADPLTAGAALLCEGETDTAEARYRLSAHGPGIDALGLPAGAAAFRDEWLALLSLYETVFVGIDADGAGDPAAARWMEALRRGTPRSRPVRVLRLPLPPGTDLRSSRVPPLDLIQSAAEGEA